MFNQFFQDRFDRRILSYLQGVNDAPDVIIAIALHDYNVVKTNAALLRLKWQGEVTETDGRWAIASKTKL